MFAFLHVLFLLCFVILICWQQIGNLVLRCIKTVKPSTYRKGNVPVASGEHH